jgi:WD40 repeat protein
MMVVREKGQCWSMDLWKGCKFRAFISYSSQDSDQGAKFQRLMEHYKIPRQLRSRETDHGRVPDRLTPLFRDRSDLEANEDLPAKIDQALQDSAWLIVLCSPRAASSRWVNKEISTFKRVGKATRIIAVLVDGLPSEYNAERNPQGAFPPALVRVVDHDGTLMDAIAPEPFAPDLRPPANDGSGGDGMHFALLKVVARMTGVALIELTQRQNEAERAERRLYRALAIGGFSLAVAAVTAAWFAIGQRNEALRAESRVLARAAHEATEANWPDRGLWLALHGLPSTESVWSLADRPMEPLALGRLSEALIEFGNRTMLFNEKQVKEAIFLPDERHVLVLLDASSMLVDLTAKSGVTRLLSSHASHPAAASPDSTAVALSDRNKVSIVDIATGEVKANLEGHSGPIWSVVYSPDGARIATGSYDRTARVWDAKTGHQLALLQGHKAPVERVAFSTDGTLVLTYANDETARLWSGQTGKPLRVFRDRGNVLTGALLSPVGDRIVTTNGKGTALVWDIKKAAPLHVLIGHKDTISAADFSRDGSRLVTASHDATARIWDVKSGIEMVAMSHPLDPALVSIVPGGPIVRSAKFSLDGQRVVTAADSQIRVWDVVSGTALKVFNTEANRYQRRDITVSYSPSGEKLLAVSTDVSILDPLAGSERLTLRGKAGDVTGAAYSPDGRMIVTTHENWGVIGWDSGSGRKLFSLGQQAGSVFAVVFNATGDRFLTASYDHVARYWNAKGGLVATLVHDAELTSIAVSANGVFLATAGGSFVRIWDATSGELVAILPNREGIGIKSVSFSPDSAQVLAGGDDGIARIWPVRGGRSTSTAKKHAGEIVRAVFSPNGDLFLTAGADGIANLWDARTAEFSRALQGHAAALTAASFSPDGRLVVTSSMDQTARLWKVRDGSLVAELRGQAGELVHASFSPDSTRVITAAEYGTGVAHIWDTQYGAPIVSLRGHTRAINTAVFSPNGRSIVTASSDGTARVWDAPRAIAEPAALIRDACQSLEAYGRHFS